MNDGAAGCLSAPTFFQQALKQRAANLVLKAELDRVSGRVAFCRSHNQGAHTAAFTAWAQVQKARLRQHNRTSSPAPAPAPSSSCTAATLARSAVLRVLCVQVELELEQKRTEWRAKIELRRAEVEELRWHVEYMQEARSL